MNSARDLSRVFAGLTGFAEGARRDAGLITTGQLDADHREVYAFDCRGHHRQLHHFGDEAAWWRNAGVDPVVAAGALWLETHPLPIVADEAALGAEAKDIMSPDSGPAEV